MILALLATIYVGGAAVSMIQDALDLHSWGILRLFNMDEVKNAAMWPLYMVQDIVWAIKNR